MITESSVDIYDDSNDQKAETLDGNDSASNDDHGLGSAGNVDIQEAEVVEFIRDRVDEVKMILMMVCELRKNWSRNI